jgi:DNA-binding MarR family transcriptional regulator
MSFLPQPNDTRSVRLQSVVRLLSRVASSLQNDLRNEGLTAHQFAALHLLESKVVAQSDLIEMMGTSKRAAMSMLLKKLHTHRSKNENLKGIALIEQERNGSNLRKKFVRITPAGKALLDRLRKKFLENVESRFGHLSETDIVNLERLLLLIKVPADQDNELAEVRMYGGDS